LGSRASARPGGPPRIACAFAARVRVYRTGHRMDNLAGGPIKPDTPLSADGAPIGPPQSADGRLEGGTRRNASPGRRPFTGAPLRGSMNADAPLKNQTLPPMSAQALVSGTRKAQRVAQQGNVEKGRSEASRRTALREATQKHDPAKLARRPDGRLGLMGVRSTSDVTLFTQFNPYGKHAFDVRAAFKLKQARGHEHTGAKTWNAVGEWYASSKSFDDYVADAKEGKKFASYRTHNIGGQLANSTHAQT